jgi:hypothetical protein
VKCGGNVEGSWLAATHMQNRSGCITNMPAPFALQLKGLKRVLCLALVLREKSSTPISTWPALSGTRPLSPAAQPGRPYLPNQGGRSAEQSGSVDSRHPIRVVLFAQRPPPGPAVRVSLNEVASAVEANADPRAWNSEPVRATIREAQPWNLPCN